MPTLRNPVVAEKLARLGSAGRAREEPRDPRRLNAGTAVAARGGGERMVRSAGVEHLGVLQHESGCAATAAATTTAAAAAPTATFECPAARWNSRWDSADPGRGRACDGRGRWGDEGGWGDGGGAAVICGGWGRARSGAEGGRVSTGVAGVSVPQILGRPDRQQVHIHSRLFLLHFCGIDIYFLFFFDVLLFRYVY